MVESLKDNNSELKKVEKEYMTKIQKNKENVRHLTSDKGELEKETKDLYQQLRAKEKDIQL